MFSFVGYDKLGYVIGKRLATDLTFFSPDMQVPLDMSRMENRQL